MNDPERNALLAENERLRSALRELREAISDENGRNLLSIVDTVWVSDIETAIDCIDAALNNPEDVPADRLLAPAAGTPPLLAAERSTKPAAKSDACTQPEERSWPILTPTSMFSNDGSMRG